MKRADSEDENGDSEDEGARLLWKSDKETAGNNACSCHTDGNMMARQDSGGGSEIEQEEGQPEQQ